MHHRKIVVTGGAKPGIGTAITRRLIREGSQVVGTYEANDALSAEALHTELGHTERLRLVAVDHGDRASLLDFARSVGGPVHGLVNAQFCFEMEDPEAFDYDLWERSLAVNLTAPNLLTHELKRDMTNGSSVIMITSTEGFIGSFGASAYAATKAAIHNLVKSLANNLGRHGIRVNAVAAGWIGGVMDTDEVFNMSRRITPLGRLGTPDEVAAVTWFLLSEEAAFINGATLVADGGYSGVDTIAKYEFDQSRRAVGAEPVGDADES